MKLTPYFAYKYLIGKKSSNAIHVITGISIFGIAIGAAALILVLSVFNGFHDILTGFFNKFNPDIKIELAEGKYFSISDSQRTALHNIPSIDAISFSLEQTALFQYDEAQEFGVLKGIDSLYLNVTPLDSSLLDGSFDIFDSSDVGAVIGLGIYNRLGCSLNDPFSNLKVFIPNTEAENQSQDKLSIHYLRPKAVFSVQQEYDYKYVFCALPLLQQFAGLEQQYSAIECRLKPGSNSQQLNQTLKTILGDPFKVRNRFQQDEAFLKLMNLEKWLYFILFSLTMVLVAFTIVGALWMIVLEKQKDIRTLKSMGMEDRQVQHIFLILGFWICAIGLMVGLLLAGIFYYLHKQYELIPIPEGFIIDSYPMAWRFQDLFVVALTVFLIGMLASIYPAKKAKEIPVNLREE